MHELAFAATQAGARVELRGWIDKVFFEQLADATGVVPELYDEARAPTVQDVVVLPEGHADPFAYATALISGARFVLMTMAPIGLMGWPFASHWERASPLTIPFDVVNRPEHFEAIAAMGITIWTNSVVMDRLASAQGVRATYVGNGTPIAFPQPAAARDVDVVWLQDNRWAPFARELAQELSCSVEAIVSTDNADMLRHFGRARVLLYPARIEGESRVTREARAMGCVPVATRGNPLATRLEDSNGVVPVDRREEMPNAITELLADPQRLATLSERAMATVLTEIAWEPFVQRVASGIEDLPQPGPAAGAWNAVGAGIRERLEQLEPATARNAELEAELERVRERNVELEIELKWMRDRRDQLERNFQTLRDRRSVRFALAASDAIRRRD